MSPKLQWLLLACFTALVRCHDDDINYGNLYRYMTLPPQDLNRLILLLQQPKFTRALVKGDEALNNNPYAPPPRYSGPEEDRRLIYYLLGYTAGPREPYRGGYADHKGVKSNVPKNLMHARKKRGFEPKFKFHNQDDAFPDWRGDYEFESPSVKLVPTA